MVAWYEGMPEKLELDNGYLVKIMVTHGQPITGERDAWRHRNKPSQPNPRNRHERRAESRKATP